MGEHSYGKQFCRHGLQKQVRELDAAFGLGSTVPTSALGGVGGCLPCCFVCTAESYPWSNTEIFIFIYLFIQPSFPDKSRTEQCLPSHNTREGKQWLKHTR